MSRTRNLNLTGRAASTHNAEVRAQLFEQQMDFLRRQRDETTATCQQIAHRLTRADYQAWWETTPDDDAGFLAAAKRKLADLELAAVMDDPSASAIEQSDAIDKWMTANWDAIPEIPL